MNSETMQYIYVLKLIPSLLDELNWTEKENEIIEDHFNHLMKLKEDGKLILAGRSLNMDEDSFGLVIFSADSKKDAQLIMNEDPALKEQIMTSKLYPYSVALISEFNSTN